MNEVGNTSWVVIKLGGTSAASARCWDNALAAADAHRERGRRVLVVHSALSGVTDRLERLHEPEGREALQSEIAARHEAAAGEMGISFDASTWLSRLRVAAEVPPADHRGRAALLAMGELMASHLVSAHLQIKGVVHRVLDARDLLTARSPDAASAATRYLSALCDDDPDASLAGRLEAMDGLLVTQGFIARDEAGDTVVLGRGGSDTSAAYFAARLGAERLEIWTDVPGMFSANPNEVSGARLLRRLDYAEAQEIATTGARVLHPRCIAPARRHRIPIHVVYAPDPSLPGTVIEPLAPEAGGRVKAVSVRHGVTLVTMETVGMWHQVGFLADAFQCFKRHGLSIDMVSTSETSVTVTLDPLVNPGAGDVLDALIADLSSLCRATALTGCSAVSLVGRQMRANLHRLAPALELFEERRVHLVSQAANDLNLTFVVDSGDAVRLVKELHALLIHKSADDPVLGPTWEQLRAPRESRAPPWWQQKRDALLAVAEERGPIYVYDRDALISAAEELGTLDAVERVYFSVKANNHPGVLALFERAGLGFECVSPGELRHVREHLPELPPERVLFTPNFAPRGDYAAGLEAGAWVTLDNLHPLASWPEVFGGCRILLRVDPGRGAGHHRHVRTAGEYSKFGIPVAELGAARRLAERAGARVAGLHMHLGSGILDPDFWREAGLRLAQLAADFPGARILNLGGGLGVPERAGEPALDLAAMNEGLKEIRRAAPQCDLWLEPGRFLVARAGVLLTRVTQVKGKGEVRYLGADTGMNSLIRPALYGAHHEIVNLSRLREPAAATFNVVGPICESGDVLGRERRLPEPREGDVLLIANAGAYGRVMASRYNLREPAGEFLLED